MRHSIMGFSQAYAASLTRKAVDANGKEHLQKIDYTDLAILRWFVDYQATGKMTSIEFSGIRYFFVAYAKILEDMPLLDITKKAMRERFQKLVAFGLLKHHLHKEFGNKVFFCMGENFAHLINSNEQNITPFERQRSYPLNVNVPTLETSTCEHNNLINDNQIKDTFPPYNTPHETAAAESGIVGDVKHRINILFNRRESTAWSDKETKQLKTVAKREGVLDQLTEIETLYNSGYQYRRRDVITFLNNFDVELDRARNKALPTYMGRPRNVDLDKYDI